MNFDSCETDNTSFDGYMCKHCTLLHCQHFSQWLLLVFMVTEKLAHVKVEAPEVTQSEIGQKQKLRVVLDLSLIHISEPTRPP